MLNKCRNTSIAHVWSDEQRRSQYYIHSSKAKNGKQVIERKLYRIIIKGIPSSDVYSSEKGVRLDQ